MVRVRHSFIEVRVGNKVRFRHLVLLKLRLGISFGSGSGIVLRRLHIHLFLWEFTVELGVCHIHTPQSNQ